MKRKQELRASLPLFADTGNNKNTKTLFADQFVFYIDPILNFLLGCQVTEICSWTGLTGNELQSVSICVRNGCLRLYARHI